MAAESTAGPGRDLARRGRSARTGTTRGAAAAPGRSGRDRESRRRRAPAPGPYDGSSGDSVRSTSSTRSAAAKDSSSPGPPSQTTRRSPRSCSAAQEVGCARPGRRAVAAPRRARRRGAPPPRTRARLVTTIGRELGLREHRLVPRQVQPAADHHQHRGGRQAQPAPLLGGVVARKHRTVALQPHGAGADDDGVGEPAYLAQHLAVDVAGHRAAPVVRAGDPAVERAAASARGSRDLRPARDRRPRAARPGLPRPRDRPAGPSRVRMSSTLLTGVR